MAKFIEFLNTPRLLHQKNRRNGDSPKTIYGNCLVWNGAFESAGGARFCFCSCWGCASFSYLFFNLFFYLSNNPILISGSCDFASARM